MIRAGMTGRQIDAAARDIIAAAGFGQCFGHALGHGVGLEIHEAPTANPRSTEIFEKNMMITVEPGIYIPKKFGVRIEDLSIVGDTGIINLVNSEKRTDHSLINNWRFLMVYASDFRKGITFEMNGEPHVVLDFQHVKPGKGAAFVRTKYRNILTGATREEAFNPDAKFENAIIETKQMQYLYNDGELYYFMDEETYDQVPLPYELVEDAIRYLRENDEATVKFYKDNAFIVEAPNFVNLKVIETEPGVKGDTATNVTKAATVETGAVIQVPIFINEGEVIQIDTRSGEYLGRAKEDK